MDSAPLERERFGCQVRAAKDVAQVGVFRRKGASERGADVLSFVDAVP